MIGIDLEGRDIDLISTGKLSENTC